MFTASNNHLVIRLGSVYTKRQRQRCDNSAMMLAILFSLKTMESLQNGVAFQKYKCALNILRTYLGSFAASVSVNAATTTGLIENKKAFQ